MARPFLLLGVVVVLSSGSPARAAAAGAPATLGEASPLEDGLAHFRARDFAGARRPLERAHAAAPDDLDAALVLAITYYRLGRAGDALPLLAAAAGSADAETAASAKVFLGLIADERGDAEGAHAYFNAVAAMPAAGLAADARTWLDASARARRSGRPERLALGVLVRPELDSNVALMPDSQGAHGAPGSGAADADVWLVATLSLRPFAGSFSLQDTVSYRQQARLAAYDLFTHSIGAREVIASDAQELSLAYHLDAAWLGDGPYLLGHLVDARYLRRVGDAFALGASGSLAYRDYLADGYLGYTGFVTSGSLDASVGGVDDGFHLDVGAGLVREDVADATLSNRGVSGRLALSLALSEDVDVLVTGIATGRRFDDTAPVREDLQLRGEATASVSLGSGVALVIGGSVLDNRSSDAGHAYLKLVGFVGLSFGLVRP